MKNNLFNKDIFASVQSLITKTKELAGSVSVNQMLGNFISIGKVTAMGSDCFKELSEITKEMKSIQQQDGWDSYWNKAENIRRLAQAIAKTNAVTQKVMNMTLLLISGVINIKQDYNTLLAYFEKANEQYSDQIEVVEIIMNMKKVLTEVKSKQDKIDDLIERQKLQGDTIEILSKVINDHSSILLKLSDTNV